MILEASSLARSLAHVYHALLNQAPPHLVINDSVNVSLLIPSLPGARHSGNSFIADSEPTQSLRPYQTLLLLSDTDEILSTLPTGSSPLLIELIQKANPLQWYLFQ